MTDPLFTSFEWGSSTYELHRHGKSTFKADYAPRGDTSTTSYTEYPYHGKAGAIPCPFCGSQGTFFTFRSSDFQGTNTSGGTDTIVYEVDCPGCRTFSLFSREDVSYPGD